MPFGFDQGRENADQTDDPLGDLVPGGGAAKCGFNHMKTLDRIDVDRHAVFC